MTQPPEISVPAGYAAAMAVGFADDASALAVVSRDRPLPVIFGAASPTMLQGNTSVSQQVGPFDAVAGGIIVVALSGTWSGTVQLLRSSDDGVTIAPLRVGGLVWGTFTKSGCEQVWSETQTGVTFFLDIDLQSGTLEYQVSQ